jgi:hypothetical protein
MKKVLLIALVLGLVTTAAAQTSNTGASGTGECKLTLAQAPAIRGIHLGMTVNEVLAFFPGAEKNEALRQRLYDSRFGWITANVVPSNYESKERFVGVRYVDFGFLDGVLNFFNYTYNGPEWKTDEQFASRVADSLNLPGVESWKEKTQFGKAVACDGFQVSVQRTPESGAGMIQVRNLENDVNKIIREREEAVKDEARRAFKP